MDDLGKKASHDVQPPHEEDQANWLWWLAGVGLAVLTAMAVVLRKRSASDSDRHPDQPLSAAQNTSVPKRAADADIISDQRTTPLELRHPDGRIEHPPVRHEATDLNSLRIAAVLFLLGVALMLVGGGARWLLRTETYRYAQRMRAASVGRQSVKFPQQPRLEALAPQFPSPKSFAVDEQAMEARLHNYGPTGEAGFVHIPIEKAMAHVAKELPSQRPIPTLHAKSQGLVGGGDANSGRVLRGSPP